MMNEELVEAGERLIATAEYISEHGHNQEGGAYGPDKYTTDTPSACVIGAWMRVWNMSMVGPQPFFNAATLTEAKALHDAGIPCVPTWSDTTPTEDVILTLKKTGTELINQGKQAL